MNTTDFDAVAGQAAQVAQTLLAWSAAPDTTAFSLVRPHLGTLEQLRAAQASFDAAVAWTAELNEAGRLVGSADPATFLTETLSISRREAKTRLERGRLMFGPPDLPEPPADATDEEKARYTDLFDREVRAKHKARALHTSPEKHGVIAAELRALHEGAACGKAELYARALERAATSAVAELKNWAREAVREANATGQADRPDPNAAHKKRFFRVHEPDQFGGVHVHGYLPQDMAAVLARAVDPVRHRLADAEAPDQAPPKKLDQRRADLLAEMAARFLNDKNAHPRGVGSIVVSMTADDLATMTADSLFPTNTGHLITPAGLGRLGEAGCDMFVLHDEYGQPISVGTGERTASFTQRIALFAAELVCSHPGCGEPISQAQVHHIQPYGKDGPTSIDNLTLLCWRHHRDNCDTRDGAGGKGHAAKDPATGRAGYRPPGGGPLRFNESTAARRAAGARIRARKHPIEKHPPEK